MLYTAKEVLNSNDISLIQEKASEILNNLPTFDSKKEAENYINMWKSENKNKSLVLAKAYSPRTYRKVLLNYLLRSDN